MITCNVRLKVVSKTAKRFKKHFSTFFYRALSRMLPAPPPLWLFPQSLQVYPPPFKKLYWASQVISIGKENETNYFTNFASTWISCLKSLTINNLSWKRSLKNLQMKLLHTAPWSHADIYVYHFYHWLFKHSLYVIAFIEWNSISPQAVSDIVLCVASINQHTVII